MGLIRRFAGRLRFPQLFFLVAALFVTDLLVPDMLPFVDEILLALLTLLLANLRDDGDEGDDGGDGDDGGSAASRPMKDVTPPG